MNSSLRLLCRPRGSLAWVGILAGCSSLLAQGNSANTPANAAKNAESASALAARFAQPAATTPLPNPIAPPAGQPVAFAVSPDQSKAAAREAALPNQMADAKGQAKKGNTEGAVRTLAALNLSQANSAEWHLETTQNLIRFAGELSREGSVRDSKTMVAESLRQLNEATRLAQVAKDRSAEARAHAAAAAIHQRYRGDPVAAMASLEAAVQANPDDTAAKEALERLQRSYANLVARGKKVEK